MHENNPEILRRLITSIFNFTRMILVFSRHDKVNILYKFFILLSLIYYLKN